MAVGFHYARVGAFCTRTPYLGQVEMGGRRCPWDAIDGLARFYNARRPLDVVNILACVHIPAKEKSRLSGLFIESLHS